MGGVKSTGGVFRKPSTKHKSPTSAVLCNSITPLSFRQAEETLRSENKQTPYNTRIRDLPTANDE